MKPQTIQKHLENCSKEELVQMFLDLARSNAAAERFLINRFDPKAPAPNFDHYKAAVRSEFFPARGFGDGNPSIAFRLLQRVEAEATNPKQVIDFIYFCVETGVEYTKAYGDLTEEFYTAVEDLFEQAAQLAATSKMINDVSDRAHHIVTNSCDIGWGFHDEIQRIFSKYFRPRKKG